jgi:hypothetical protein
MQTGRSLWLVRALRHRFLGYRGGVVGDFRIKVLDLGRTQ